LHLYWEKRCKGHTELIGFATPPQLQAKSGLAAAPKAAPKAAPVAAPVAADTGSYDGGSGASEDWVMMRSCLYFGGLY